MVYNPFDVKFVDYTPKGDQDYTPLHLLYPDSEGKADPSFTEGFVANLKYQWLPITNATQEYFAFASDPYDENFDWKQTIQDNNDYLFADELSRAKNSEHYNYIKDNLLSMQQNRKVFERSGIGATLVAGVVDPLNIAFFHPVFNTGIRAAWAAKSAFGVTKEAGKMGFLFGMGSEALRSPFDPFNTYQESVTNIAGNTVFAGLLGGGSRGIANKFSNIVSKHKNLKDPNPKTNDVFATEDAINKGSTDPNFKQPLRSSLRELPIDRYNFINKFLPSRRLQFGKYDGVEAPEIVKDLDMQIEYNGSVSMQGKPMQSIDMMQQRYKGKGLHVEAYLDNLYMEEMYKTKGTGKVAGIDYVTPTQKMQSIFGKQLETRYFNDATQDYLKAMPSKAEFKDEIIRLQILNGNPAWNKAYFSSIPEYKRKGMERIAQFYREFDVLAQDQGVFHSKEGTKKALAKLDVRIKELDQKIIAEKDKAAKEIFKLSRNSLLKQKNFYEVDYSPTRANYKWAIYYDKQLLIENPDKQNELTDIFANHFLEEGFVTKFTKGDTPERIPVTSLSQAQRVGREFVDTILEKGDDPYGYSTPMGVGKAKHIMMRATNIPEWKVIDFIVKDPAIMSQYAKMMGFRIEYARKFGDDSIDYLLDMIEAEMQSSKKYTQKAIAEIKSDLLAGYEKVAGQISRDPSRFDTKFARISRKLSGMTYLTGAGLTAATETVAMPIMEHGLGNVLRSVFRAVDGNFDKIKANAKDLQHSSEGLELSQRAAVDRILGDLVRPVKVGKIEKTADAFEDLFYKFNGLSLITAVGKFVDSSIRIPKFYKQIKNYDSLDEFDIEDLNRYGIDKVTAKRLADNGGWQFTDTDMPLLNIQGWSDKTKADRDLKAIMQTYLANGARNTIIHATSFDRPNIADGFVFKKWKPYMAKMGIQPDPRASVGKQADGSYRYPIARIESGVMAFPFQFYNFSFAANQRILRPMFDPQKKFRLQGAIALMGMSYIILAMRKPDWWFENKDYPELIMQITDRSGILGLYSELAYRGIEAAGAFGLYNPDDSWLKGRYNATGWDSAFGLLGATPNMYREWVIGANEIINDNTEEGLKTISYNFPLLGLMGLDDDLRALGSSRNR